MDAASFPHSQDFGQGDVLLAGNHFGDETATITFLAQTCHPHSAIRKCYFSGDVHANGFFWLKNRWIAGLFLCDHWLTFKTIEGIDAEWVSSFSGL